MKSLITFVLGALTGAFLLWFGFGKKVVTLGHELVLVDRFTGKASRIFVSHLEAEKLEMDESARIEAMINEAIPQAKAEAKPAGWRELTAAEIEKLEFRWLVSGSSVHINYHNPFEKEVRVEKVRVQLPAHDGHAAIDREYQMQPSICPPMADSSERMTSMHIPADLFKQDSQSTPQSADSQTVSGTITPARILIRE